MLNGGVSKDQGSYIYPCSPSGTHHTGGGRVAQSIEGSLRTMLKLELTRLSLGALAVRLLADEHVVDDGQQLPGCGYPSCLLTMTPFDALVVAAEPRTHLQAWIAASTVIHLNQGDPSLVIRP